MIEVCYPVIGIFFISNIAAENISDIESEQKILTVYFIICSLFFVIVFPIILHYEVDKKLEFIGYEGQKSSSNTYKYYYNNNLININVDYPAGPIYGYYNKATIASSILGFFFSSLYTVFVVIGNIILYNFLVYLKKFLEILFFIFGFCAAICFDFFGKNNNTTTRQRNYQTPIIENSPQARSTTPLINNMHPTAPPLSVNRPLQNSSEVINTRQIQPSPIVVIEPQPSAPILNISQRSELNNGVMEKIDKWRKINKIREHCIEPNFVVLFKSIFRELNNVDDGELLNLFIDMNSKLGNNVEDSELTILVESNKIFHTLHFIMNEEQLFNLIMNESVINFMNNVIDSQLYKILYDNFKDYEKIVSISNTYKRKSSYSLLIPPNEQHLIQDDDEILLWEINNQILDKVLISDPYVRNILNLLVNINQGKIEPYERRFPMDSIILNEKCYDYELKLAISNYKKN